MINLSNFMIVLLDNSKWINLFMSLTKISTNELIIYGDCFITRKANQITNKFWRDTLLSGVKIKSKHNP